MLLFALLVLIVSIALRTYAEWPAANLSEKTIEQNLFYYLYVGDLLDDVTGVVLGLLVYGFYADALLDVELLKDLALGYLIATKTFAWAFSRTHAKIMRAIRKRARQ